MVADATSNNTDKRTQAEKIAALAKLSEAAKSGDLTKVQVNELAGILRSYKMKEESVLKLESLTGDQLKNTEVQSKLGDLIDGHASGPMSAGLINRLTDGKIDQGFRASLGMGAPADEYIINKRIDDVEEAAVAASASDVVLDSDGKPIDFDAPMWTNSAGVKMSRAEIIKASQELGATEDVPTPTAPEAAATPPATNNAVQMTGNLGEADKRKLVQARAMLNDGNNKNHAPALKLINQVQPSRYDARIDHGGDGYVTPANELNSLVAALDTTINTGTIDNGNLQNLTQSAANAAQANAAAAKSAKHAAPAATTAPASTPAAASTPAPVGAVQTVSGKAPFSAEQLEVLEAYKANSKSAEVYTKAAEVLQSVGAINKDNNKILTKEEMTTLIDKEIADREPKKEVAKKYEISDEQKKILDAFVKEPNMMTFIAALTVLMQTGAIKGSDEVPTKEQALSKTEEVLRDSTVNGAEAGVKAEEKAVVTVQGQDLTELNKGITQIEVITSTTTNKDVRLALDRVGEELADAGLKRGNDLDKKWIGDKIDTNKLNSADARKAVAELGKTLKDALGHDGKITEAERTQINNAIGKVVTEAGAERN